MFVMMPMMPHAVMAMTPPREHDQKHDEQNWKEGKEEMMRVRTNRIRCIGIEIGSPEQPDDRGHDQGEHRHARQQMKPMMQAPMTPPSARLVIVGRVGLGGLVHGKFFS